jgi:tetratricopeptide (TPR) repeat protein
VSARPRAWSPRPARRVIGRALWLCLCLYLVGGGRAGVAWAQSERYPPSSVDVDERERASSFWERVLHPAGQRYEHRVAAARALLAQPDGQAAEQALTHLDEAVAMAPGHPEGHWLRGVAGERLRRWDVCAASYGRVFAIEPGYVPGLVPPGRDPSWALDAGLGLCLARRGDYEAALVNFKRIASRGVTGAAQSPVAVYTAETYMALGRLSEAIDVLALASRHQPSTARIEHALAAAHDRREMPDQAREHLRAALRLAPLGALEAPDQVFIPAEQALYSLGLAYAELGEPERALIYFRHYLHAHGDGPWRQRAQQHVERLARIPRAPKSIAITNPGNVDAAAVPAAVERIEPALQACVRSLPGVLFSVRLIQLEGGGSAARSAEQRPSQRSLQRSSRSASRRSPSPAPRSAIGVETQVVHRLPDVTEDAVAEAQRCLETAAQDIALPRSRSQASDYMMVTFQVIAR